MASTDAAPGSGAARRPDTGSGEPTVRAAVAGSVGDERRDAEDPSDGEGASSADAARAADGADVSAPASEQGADGATEPEAAGVDARAPATPVARAGDGSPPVQEELDELGDPERLRSAVEAVLLVVDTPTSALMLAQVLGRSVPEVEGALRSLRDEYDAGGRGLDLREVADGWRLYSRDEFASCVERFILDGQQARLTQAALETLAVIAYRQPVTRSRISGIRGVSVDAVMRTLLTRGLVEECGADRDTGGGLYRTTRLFLEKMGLRSLDELPSLAPLLPDTSQLDDVELST
jgi:segregation and condensation protein B